MKQCYEQHHSRQVLHAVTFVQDGGVTNNVIPDKHSTHSLSCKMELHHISLQRSTFLEDRVISPSSLKTIYVNNLRYAAVLRTTSFRQPLHAVTFVQDGAPPHINGTPTALNICGSSYYQSILSTCFASNISQSTTFRLLVMEIFES
ncbi:hypothetical protein AVEN_166306-1 [Araneus ventricosus]|uniref:Uncharacterized protein n=1 Tax=Araneus ventricosus TaxID=182803 RepID=A0A4Y2LCS1_ARAVE|nr:hypothetical protein AVEN_166306-1 [Araneus ventricosus]